VRIFTVDGRKYDALTAPGTVGAGSTTADNAKMQRPQAGAHNPVGAGSTALPLLPGAGSTTADNACGSSALQDLRGRIGAGRASGGADRICHRNGHRVPTFTPLRASLSAMTTLNEAVDDFELPGTGGNFRLSSARGKPVVLYFYPKDNTPGCTTEAQQFRDLDAEFRQLGCTVLGISRDSVKSHEGFRKKLALPFDLLSDEAELLCQQFAVIQLKNLYGKQVRGIERSTFVMDGTGVLRAEWRGVKVPGHAREVLDFVASL
jgi:peroxiredoxin Q/BCP